ncbi:MAG TPA: glucoamylase family protein, partial [Opitutus sp.]|nr:glucoamylase family protein [Opitutus sp.]
MLFHVPQPWFLACAFAAFFGIAGGLAARQSSAAGAPAALAAARPGAILTLDDDALLEEIEHRAFRFFREQSNPLTGLVRDRARADGAPSEGKASISAEGFALAAWAIAVQRGWVDRKVAVERVRLMLRFLATKAPRVHGFFYHFMEMDTGARAWQCELSSIDTGFFLAGAIVAREYFQDPEITALVDQLYRETDWSWFLNGGQTVAMGWHPEGGFSRFRWGFYAEHMMMSFLGMGAPQNALSRDYWQTWKREPVGTYAGYHFIEGPPLFIHQYAHAFVDFRDLRDAFADYYHNSVLATLAQRQFCIDLRSEFPTWSERLWGVTASDSATGYKAWGGPPRTTEFNALDGTIVPCAAAGSVPFAPYETLMVLHHIRTVYGDRTWKRYGFVDAFNPQTGWVDSDVIGIDQGISLLQAENARTGFLWALFMQAPEVKRALARSGFVSESRAFSWPEREQLRALAGDAWNSLDPEAPLPDTLGLRLTAVPAAEVLGLIDGGVALRRAQLLLDSAVPPQTDVAVAEYAAGLVALRQAIPSLATQATQLLEKIDWNRITPSSTKLGSASRLATFFKIAAGKSPASAWAGLVRSPEQRGAVYVLSPADPDDQLLPGMWINERPIISGASAEELAYSLAVEPPDDANAPPPPPLDVPTAALLLDHFPAEFLGRIQETPPAAGWIERASAQDRAALLITIANLLVPDCVREWCQQDALVRAARAAIPEFGEAAFGPNSSVYQRYELAGPFVPPPERDAIAVRANTPHDQWPWTTISGL